MDRSRTQQYHYMPSYSSIGGIASSLKTGVTKDKNTDRMLIYEAVNLPLKISNKPARKRELHPRIVQQTEAEMVMNEITFRHVSYTYDTLPEILFSEIDLSIERGWTGLVGPNGSGKTTLLKLAAGKLKPDTGNIIFDGDAIYCEQRTDVPTDLEREFVYAYDGQARKLIGLLGIEAGWIERWDTLSHGERKRIQLGAALWRSPDLLAVDEPTNHLDGIARNLVTEALLGFNGIGILVSHDRELLDRLTARTLIIENGEILMRTGKFTDAYDRRKEELAQSREAYMSERRSFEKLKREQARRRREADQADSKRRNLLKGVDRKDSDARGKKNLAIITGRDAVAGKLLNQMDGRMKQAETKLDALKIGGERKTGVSMETSRGKFDSVYSAGEERIQMGDGKELILPPLFVGPDSRIGISGPNGSGKSTLIRHIVNISRIDPDRMIYIPQEIGLEKTKLLTKKMRSLPKTDLGDVLATVSRLGTEPEALLYSDTPSPGEVRKIMLALGIHSQPFCIIMDEPTNHMDIPSVECVETVLSASTCALILVSHDNRFLDTLTDERWEITCDRKGKSCKLNILLQKPRV